LRRGNISREAKTKIGTNYGNAGSYIATVSCSVTRVSRLLRKKTAITATLARSRG
jgi:hypothetical protein